MGRAVLSKKAISYKVRRAPHQKTALSQTMDVFTLGGATQDIFIHYQDPESLVIKNSRETRSYLLLEKGAKIAVDHIGYSTGGGAANTAIAFKRLGFNVATIIKTGAGKAGQYIENHLTSCGIDTQYMIKDKTMGTGLSYIIPSFEGDRTIFAYRGANEKIAQKDIPFNALEKANCLYVTPLSGQSSDVLLPVVKFAKKYNVQVAVNPGMRQLTTGCQELARALKFVDIFILNSQEAKSFLVSLANQRLPKKLDGEITAPGRLAGLPQLIKSLVYIEEINFNLKDFCKEILHRGPAIVAVTNGDEGVYVAYKDTIYFYPSLPTATVDSVGAGDAFGAGFAASIFLGKSIEEALIDGVINASSVIAYEDATSGLLTKKQIDQRSKTVDRSLMKKFKL